MLAVPAGPPPYVSCMQRISSRRLRPIDWSLHHIAMHFHEKALLGLRIRSGYGLQSRAGRRPVIFARKCPHPLSQQHRQVVGPRRTVPSPWRGDRIGTKDTKFSRHTSSAPRSSEALKLNHASLSRASRAAAPKPRMAAIVAIGSIGGREHHPPQRTPLAARLPPLLPPGIVTPGGARTERRAPPLCAVVRPLRDKQPRGTQEAL